MEIIQNEFDKKYRPINEITNNNHTKTISMLVIGPSKSGKTKMIKEFLNDKKIIKYKKNKLLSYKNTCKGISYISNI